MCDIRLGAWEFGSSGRLTCSRCPAGGLQTGGREFRWLSMTPRSCPPLPTPNGCPAMLPRCARGPLHPTFPPLRRIPAYFLPALSILPGKGCFFHRCRRTDGQAQCCVHPANRTLTIQGPCVGQTMRYSAEGAHHEVVQWYQSVGAS